MPISDLKNTSDYFKTVCVSLSPINPSLHIFITIYVLLMHLHHHIMRITGVRHYH